MNGRGVNETGVEDKESMCGDWGVMCSLRGGKGNSVVMLCEKGRAGRGKVGRGDLTFFQC